MRNRAIAQLEARRDGALRELERRRAALARQLRQALKDAEDAAIDEVPEALPDRAAA